MNLFVSIILFSISFLITYRESEISKKNQIFYLLLFIFHFSLFFFYYDFSLNQEKDSYLFFHLIYENSDISEYLYPGSRFITLLVYPLVSIGLSYFNVSLLFSVISFIGFIYLLREVLFIYEIKREGLILSIILLLFTPTLHLWTSGLTKEALIFPLMVFIFKAFTVYDRKNVLKIILAIIILLLIRPYLGLIMIMSFVLITMLNKEVSKKLKGLTVVIFSVITVAVLPILKQFLNVDSISYSSFLEIIDRIKGYSSTAGNSSISLETTTYFERILMVLFRPLFFDAYTINQYIVSIENLLTIGVYSVFIYTLSKRKVKIGLTPLFLLSTSILIVLFLGIYMYNLGLASRMRVMYLPYLVIFMILILNNSSGNKEEVS